MTRGICAAFDGEPCSCFAVQMGGECVHCASSRTCLPAANASALCSDDPHSRRDEAQACGQRAGEINLVHSPASVLPGSLRLPWVGSELVVDLGAVFHVEKISMNLLSGTAQLHVSPKSDLRSSDEAVWRCASDGNSSSTACAWPLSIPLVSNFTLRAVAGASEFKATSLQALLSPYEPVDGVFEEASGWSECSTSCGEGVQSRALVCVEPQYGGLPCMDANGKPVEGEMMLTRNCEGFLGCGTNWTVVLIIGWWQLVLVSVFVTRKVWGVLAECLRARRAKEETRRRRFSSDADEDDLALPDALRKLSLGDGNDASGNDDLELDSDPEGLGQALTLE